MSATIRRLVESTAFVDSCINCVTSLGDWSSFVPDLLVGMATGGVVGLILFKYQRFSERVQLQFDVRRVASRLIQPLLLAIQRPVRILQYTDVSILPKKIGRILELIEHEDVDYWHETAPTPLTQELLRFRSAAWDLREDASDLSEALRRWCDIHASTAPDVLVYASAVILNAPSQLLVNKFPDSSIRSALASRTDDALESHYVKLHHKRFRKAQRKTAALIVRLEKALIEQMQKKKRLKKRWFQH